MGDLATLAAEVLSNSATPGAPSTGPRKPRLQDFRELFRVADARIESIYQIAVGLTGGAVETVKSTETALQLVDPGAGTFFGLVVGDEVDKNGWWKWVDSAPWVYQGPLGSPPTEDLAALEAALDEAIDDLADLWGRQVIHFASTTGGPASYTAVLPDGVTAETGMLAVFTPPVASGAGDGDNPKLNTVVLRTESGGVMPAGYLRAGTSYLVLKLASQWRVLTGAGVDARERVAALEADGGGAAAASALADEVALRQAGDATNAAAAAAADGKAVAAQAAANAVAVRAAALEAETARLATLPIASPGRYPEHWAVYAAGVLTDIPTAWVQTSPWGPALRVPANTEVVSRHIYPTLPGRALRCLAGVARAVNSTDEAGEAVRIRARAVDMAGSVIGSPIALHTVNNLTVSPLLYQPPLPDIVLGAIGIAQVEPPTGTVGVRLSLSTAAGDAYTWFVDFGALDMARAVAPSVTATEVAALQAAVNALGTRTTNLETAIDGPTRRVFESYLHFMAATADDLDGVTTVGLIGWEDEHDEAGAVLFRASGGEIEHPTGSSWTPRQDRGEPIGTLAELAERYVSPTAVGLRLAGRNWPGVGAAHYRRVAEDPGHPYAGQDALGGWWEIDETAPTYRQLGIEGASGKWAAVTTYIAGEIYEPLNANYTGYNYRVVVAGTTGASQPAWPSTIGETVIDGTVTWQCVKRLLHDEINAAYVWAAARRKIIHGEGEILRYGGALKPADWGGVYGHWTRFWRDKSYQSAGPGTGGFPTYTYPTGQDYVEHWTERQTIYGVDPDEDEGDCSGNGWQLAFKNSSIEDVIFDGYKAIAFLVQSEDSTFRRIRSRNAARPGGSGCRFTVFRNSVCEDCDWEGDDDTCIVGNGRVQRYSLDGEETALASDGGVFVRNKAKAKQGAVFSVVGGPQENTIGPLTSFNNPLIFEAGSTLMIFVTGVAMQTLAAGDSCVISGVTDPMVSAAGLTAADVNGTRTIATMSPVDPTGFFETDRLLIGITIGAAATATVRTGSPFRDDGRVQFLRVTTVDGDATVKVWFRGHDLADGQITRVNGWQDGLGGIAEGAANGSRVVAVLNDDEFTFEADTPASASVTADQSSADLQYTPYLTGRIGAAWRGCIGESGDSTETGNGGVGTKDYNVPFQDGVFVERENTDVTHGDQNTGDEARPCHHMIAVAGPMRARFIGGVTYSPNGSVALIETIGSYDRVTNKAAEYYFEGRTLEAQRATGKPAYEAQGGRGMSFIRSKIYVNAAATTPHFKFGYLSDDSVEELYLEDTDIIGVGAGQNVFDFSRLKRLIIRGRVTITSAEGVSDSWNVFKFTDSSVLEQFSIENLVVDAGCASLFSAGAYAAIRSRVAAAGQRDAPVKNVIGKAFPTSGAVLTYAELASYNAAQFPGVILATSNGNAGGPGPVYSDGTDWLVLSTGATISAS